MGFEKKKNKNVSKRKAEEEAKRKAEEEAAAKRKAEEEEEEDSDEQDGEDNSNDSPDDGDASDDVSDEKQKEVKKEMKTPKKSSQKVTKSKDKEGDDDGDSDDDANDRESGSSDDDGDDEEMNDAASDGDDDDDDDTKASEPPAPEEDKTKIYVRGLPWKATEEEVSDFFKECGKGVKAVELPLQKDGRSSGTANIEFETPECAAAAMKLDGKDFQEGRWLKIVYYRAKAPPFPKRPTKKPEACTTVFVGNVPWGADEDTVEEMFEKCGEIKSVRKARNEGGSFMGYCFVNFYETEAVDRAKELDGTELLGRSIRVEYVNEDERKSKKRSREKEFLSDGSRKTKKAALLGSRRDGRVVQIVVRGLAFSATRSEVWELFKDCGEGPKAVELPRRNDGKKSGMAIVDFETRKCAAAAIRLNGTKLKERTLRVSYKGRVNVSGCSEVYVSGLPWKATRTEVWELFKQCGDGPKAVELPLLEDGRSSGTAIVEFETPECAAAAVVLSGTELHGRWLKIVYSDDKLALDKQKTEKPEGCTAVFVGNLPFKVDEQTMKNTFKKCGEIKGVHLAKDRTGKFRGFGQVEFCETEAADEAMKMTGSDLMGRQVRVEYARPRVAGGSFLGEGQEEPRQ